MADLSEECGDEANSGSLAVKDYETARMSAAAHLSRAIANSDQDVQQCIPVRFNLSYGILADLE